MLYKGKFVRSFDVVKPAPYDTGKIRIGEFYTPPLYQKASTPEERFMRDIVLGDKPQRESPITKFFGRLLSV